MSADLTWTCALHGPTDSDCGGCDDELMAMADAPCCRSCGRLLLTGEDAWVEDVKVIGPGSVRIETRYTCDDCEAAK